MNKARSSTREQPSISIWLFVGATFLFVAPELFLPGTDLWVKIAFIVAGFVVVVIGGIQLGREIARGRTGRGDLPPESPDAPDTPQAR